MITFQGAPYYPLAGHSPAPRIQLDRDALALALEIPPDQFTPLRRRAGRDRSGCGRWPGPAAFSTTTCSTRPATTSTRASAAWPSSAAFHAGNTLLSGLLLQDLTTDPEVIRLDTRPQPRLAGPAHHRPPGRQHRPGRGVLAAGPLRRVAVRHQLRHRPRVRHLPAADDRRPRAPGFGGRRVHRQRAARGPLGPAGPVRHREPAGGHRRRRGAAARHRPARPRAADHPVLLCQLAPAEAGTARFRLPGSVRCGATTATTASTMARRWPAPPTATASPTASPARPMASSSPTSRAACWAAPICWAAGGSSAAGSALGRSDGGPGVLGQLAYEYDGRSFSFGARTRYTSDGYREAGGDEETARVDQLSLGLDFGERGRFGALFAAYRRPRHRERHDACRHLQRGARAGCADAARGPAVRARTMSWRSPPSTPSRWVRAARPPPRSSSAAATTPPAASSVRRAAPATSVLDYRLAAEAGTRDSSLQAAAGLPDRRSAAAISRSSASTAATPCAPASTAASP